jgi:hypothetical protein
VNEDFSDRRWLKEVRKLTKHVILPPFGKFRPPLLPRFGRFRPIPCPLSSHFSSREAGTKKVGLNSSNFLIVVRIFRESKNVAKSTLFEKMCDRRLKK